MDRTTRAIRCDNGHCSAPFMAFARLHLYLWRVTSARSSRFGVVVAAAVGAAMALAAPAAAAKTKKAAPPDAANAAAPAPATALTPAARPLGTVDSWTAYMSQDKTGRVCYVFGQPRRSEPANLKRKSPAAMVTHRPDEKIADVVSFVEGYPLKEGSEVVLDVGGAKFEMFTKDDSAWARTAELDKTIVATLAKGKQAVVKGQPHKGGPSIDTYSLAGFAKTLAMIDKACGVKR